MEKQDPTGITDRKLGLKIGDFVTYSKGNSFSVFKILKNINFWNKSTVLRKATKQEYIVAKLKGRLYE